MAIEIVGVHSVDAPGPCHIIEVKLSPPHSDCDWGAITQETADQPKDNWQVPWGEQSLDDTGTDWVFFFHYLDTSQPLITPDGPKDLPAATPIPDHLAGIVYEGP